MAEEQGILRSPFTDEARQLQDTLFYRELYSRRVYRYDAVSGAQIRVKLGENVIVEDATAVQYTLSQGKKPIYGYASQLFDAIAQGVVIVHGRLWINFIHQGYLRLLLKAASDGGQSLVGTNLAADQRLEFDSKGIPLDSKNLIEHVKKENYDRNDTQARLESVMSSRPDEKPAVNITIHFGNPELYDVPKKKIWECHFVAEGSEINISGQPIQEWYEFVAKRVT